MPGEGDDVLLDTHALLWWQARSDRLSPRAGRRIAAARSVLISPITCWEVGMLVAKGRVRLDRSTSTWIRDVLAQDRLTLAEVDPEIAVAAAELPDFHGDPADRFLYATARARRADLVSKDAPIRHYADVHRDVAVVW